MSTIQSIEKQNVSGLVYGQMQRAIATGEWPPGEKIPSENELAARMGVSRVSVRTALQKLAGLGLVESRQGEGTFVRTFSGGECMAGLLPAMLVSRPQMGDMLELRKILETGSARLAARRRTAGQLEALRGILARHKACRQDTTRAAECDLQFHYQIAEMTGNPLLIQVYAVVKEVYQAALYDIVTVMGTHNAEHYHGALIDAIEAGDARRAGEVMAEHIDDTVHAAQEAAGRGADD